MSKPFSSMFARRYSKRQVTNRDFNFVRDWNADSSDGRSSDNHDTFSAKVTPRAQYIISSSKPSPAHGNHHIPELSDLIGSSPIPVVIQSPPARAIPSKQASIEEDEDDDGEEEVVDEEDEEEMAGEEDEEEMADEEESGRDGDASMADSTMAVKDDGESESESFVVEATIQHAEEEEDVNSTLHRSRKDTTPRARYSTFDHSWETIDNRADEYDGEKDRGQQGVHHDEGIEEEEKEEQFDKHQKLNRSSRYVEQESKKGLSSRARRSRAEDKEEEEGITDIRVKKTSSQEEKNLNHSSRNLRSRSRGNDQQDNITVLSSKSDMQDNSDGCIDRLSSRTPRTVGNQIDRSKRSRGHHIETVIHDETRERDDRVSESLIQKSRQSFNDTANVRNSVSKSPRQNLNKSPRQNLNKSPRQNLNKSGFADEEKQNQTFERRKTHSGKRLTRHSSMEQNVSDEDVSEKHDSDLEKETSSGERKETLSGSRAESPPEGATDEEEEIGGDDREDMAKDVRQDQMLQDETAASIMIQSSMNNTPLTTKSPRKRRRSLVSSLDDDNEKEADDDTSVARPKTPVPPTLKQTKISFSSETKKSDKKKRKEPVHKLGLWQGEMDKRYKKSVLDLDLVLNDLDDKLEEASSEGHLLTTMKKKECQLLSHIRKKITKTIEAVEETRQKRTEILRTKRNIKESRTELSELQQKNMRLSEKLGNEENEKVYRRKLLNDWITSFETLMKASRDIKTKSSIKGMVSFGYLPKIE